MPIDLNALFAGSEEEFNKVFDELGLWSFAKSQVTRFISADFLNDVPDIANKACLKLVQNLRSDSRWVRDFIGDDPSQIRWLLLRYVRDEVTNFLRHQRRQRQIRFQQIHEDLIRQVEGGNARAQIRLVRELGVAGYERALAFVAAESELDLLETACLDAVIVHQVPFEQFGREHGVP